MLVTAPDRTVAVSKRSHCLDQLAYASNEPKDTIPRRHGGPRRLHLCIVECHKHHLCIVECHKKSPPSLVLKKAENQKAQNQKIE